MNYSLASCSQRKSGCICPRCPACPRVFMEAPCLSKLDFTHSKGKSSPDYAEEVHISITSWEIHAHLCLWNTSTRMINAALVPLGSQLFCLRSTNFSSLSCFDSGEDMSSTALPALRAQVHGGNEGAEVYFYLSEMGKQSSSAYGTWTDVSLNFYFVILASPGVLLHAKLTT